MPKNEPLIVGANIVPLADILCAVISYTTFKSPFIDADVLTLNPKSGDISAN